MHIDIHDRRFRELSARILDTIWCSSPVGATLRGIHDHDHTLGDVSADAFEDYARTFRKYVEALESDVDPSMLDPEEEIDYHMALSLASSSFINLECQRPWEKDPSLYASIAIWGSFSLLNSNHAPLEDRAHAILCRLREIPDLIRTARQNIRTPPVVFAQVGVEVTQGGLAFLKSAIPGLASQVPGLESSLAKANHAAITALEGYRNWLTESVVPQANGGFAVGQDIYEQLLFAEHYLTYSPDDLVRLAKHALDEVQEQITEVAGQIDPSRSWQQLISDLKHDHPGPDTLVNAYRQAVEASKSFVLDHDLVTLAPDEHLEVRETPDFERCVMPYAAYFPPAPFGTSRTGSFWVTPIDRSAPLEQQEAQLLGHCSHAIPIIALHEGYPGHHVQLTLASCSPSPIRKQVMNNLLIEGWALYCEEMMYEQGFCSDLRVRLFQLKEVLWRACRVLIDVGLHAGGMTFDEAVEILVNTAHLEPRSAVAEVKRYTMSPTQPMTYLIGKLLILDMRDRMKRQLGRRFDLKSFHDQLLSFGSIPPALITQRLMTTPGPLMRPVPQRRTA